MRLDHVAEIEGALLLRHAGVEDDLQQQIAELVLQVGEIVARDGVGDLVGFLERIGRDGPEILLQVPRAAAAGRAQRRHDLDQAGNVAGGLHRGWTLAGVGADRWPDRSKALRGLRPHIRDSHKTYYGIFYIGP